MKRLAQRIKKLEQKYQNTRNGQQNKDQNIFILPDDEGQYQEFLNASHAKGKMQDVTVILLPSRET